LDSLWTSPFSTQSQLKLKYQLSYWSVSKVYAL